MENPMNKLEAAQTKLHNLESSQTNALAKISGTKLNVILIMLTALITYFSVIFYDSFDKQIKNNRKVIWFDRQREHPSESFAKVDEKFPAGYEIWEGKKLIERWHWKIENDPRTHQFGDFILRCVAKYSDDGAYIGYTEYQMVDYPTEQHEEFESLRKPDALVFHLSTKKGFVTLSKPTITAKWKGAKYVGAEKVSDGFPHSKNQVHASMLIENQTDLDYVEWLTERFKFLQNDVVNAYLSKKEFEQIIEMAPDITQAAWGRFVESMNQDCEATQDYIKNKWNNRQIEDIVTN
jgi:hypothetical protein